MVYAGEDGGDFSGENQESGIRNQGKDRGVVWRSLLVILGLDPRIQLKRLIPAFAGNDISSSLGFVSVIDQQDKPKLVVVTKPDAQQAHLNIGLRTFARASEDRFAWSILNMIMGSASPRGYLRKFVKSGGFVIPFVLALIVGQMWGTGQFMPA